MDCGSSGVASEWGIQTRQVYEQSRCHKKFYTCLQIFYYNPESKEDIHLAHIELPITSPKTLTDPRAAIVFQPMAQASPARTKTNRRPDDQFRGGSNFFSLNLCQMVVFIGFQVIDKYLITKKILTTSNCT